jgi:ribosomal protein S6--L-glutamate ligase
MIETLVIVNGEEFWADYFPEYKVYQVRLQTSKWLLHDGKLWVYDNGLKIRVDSLLWRIGAVQPHPNHRDILELIRFSGVPCLNSAELLLRDLHRLTMLNDLKEGGLPLVAFSAIVGPALMTQLPMQLPAIIKVGTYHAGYGKMRLSTLEQWQDMTDMVFATKDYFTIEPFIDYVRDIRCLAVGNQVWALARSGSRWKANTGFVDSQLIPAPEILYNYTLAMMQRVNADLLALDILETAEGQYHVLEYNAVPGLAAFPVTVIEAIVERMKAKILAAS